MKTISLLFLFHLTHSIDIENIDWKNKHALKDPFWNLMHNMEQFITTAEYNDEFLREMDRFEMGIMEKWCVGMLEWCDEYETKNVKACLTKEVSERLCPMLTHDGSSSD